MENLISFIPDMSWPDFTVNLKAWDGIAADVVKHNDLQHTDRHKERGSLRTKESVGKKRKEKSE